MHREVLETVLAAADELGLQLSGLTFSPITGGEGNIEFLAYWRLAQEPVRIASQIGLPSSNKSSKMPHIHSHNQSGRRGGGSPDFFTFWGQKGSTTSPRIHIGEVIAWSPWTCMLVY